MVFGGVDHVIAGCPQVNQLGAMLVRQFDPAVMLVKDFARVAAERVEIAGFEPGHRARPADAVKCAIEYSRMRNRCTAQIAEVCGKTGTDEAADMLRTDHRAGYRDEIHIHPIVCIEEHQQAASALENELLDRVLFSPAVEIVRPDGLSRPTRRDKLGSTIVQ